MTAPLPFHAIIDPSRPAEIPVAWRPDGTLLRLGQFRADVSALAARLAQRRDVLRWALCFEDAANLATALFAALLAGRQIVLPGHTREALLREMHEAGHFEGVLTDIPALRGKGAPSIGPIGLIGPIGQMGTENLVSPIEDATPAAPTVSFFTSGSTGQPKCVTKTIAQLQIENDLHAAHWGQRLPGTHIVGTTAHHHLYGLQFRILLPLTLSVPFNTTLIEFHEQLLTVPRPFALITSPAFLKRLDDHIPLPANSCRHILSAGGFLPPDTATRATALLGIAPFEIYGSTEAGAIAWRDTDLEPHRWRPLPCVQIETDTDGRLSLHSDFLPVDAPQLITDDQIHLEPDGAFTLLGRLDRILKIEEKRVALPDVEARLRALDGVADAAVVPLQNAAATRTFLGAVLVLDPAGQQHYAALSPGQFLVELRQRLRPVLEPVAIPRQIKVVPRIPENTQGKRDTAQLQRLFAPLFPHEFAERKIEGAVATIDFELQPALLWFKGHFDAHPILPGVTQLHWAIHYATAIFAPKAVFSGVDVIKFRNPLCPGDRAELVLRWDAAQHRLTFTYSRAGDIASTGKIRFVTPQ